MLRFSLLAAVLFILAGTASADRKQNDMGCHAMTINTEVVTSIDRPCIEEADSTEVQEQRTSPREELVFYYHTDHLDSSNLVTDGNGDICHATEYLPYGEEFVDLMASGSDPELPFKFNGKELDSETGLLYYGARYYMPKYYQWPTCDPMQLKYPGVSSYAYCMGNPVKLIDLFGLAPGDFFRTVNAAAVDFGLFYNYNSISASSKEMVDDIIRDSLRQAQEPSATSSGTIGDRLRNHLRYLFRLSLIDVQRPQKKSCKEWGNTSPKCAESSCLSDFPMVR